LKTSNPKKKNNAFQKGNRKRKFHLDTLLKLQIAKDENTLNVVRNNILPLGALTRFPFQDSGFTLTFLLLVVLKSLDHTVCVRQYGTGLTRSILLWGTVQSQRRYKATTPCISGGISVGPQVAELLTGSSSSSANSHL
jgi:hypothetical protein